MVLRSLYRLVVLGISFHICRGDYYLIGVSGSLQDGYSLRPRLDYTEGDDTTVKAILLGKVLIRGYKAYLDVMEDGWRQYVAPVRSAVRGEDISKPGINPDVIATGCYEHANEHFVYLIDSRQVLTVLMEEPRFLSITPDTGLVDLMSGRTSSLIKHIAKHETIKQGKSNGEHVAIPLVTSVWHQSSSFVPSPSIASEITTTTSDDNENITITTEITNFPDSLALWAGVSSADRLEYLQALDDCQETKTRASQQHQDCIVEDHPAYQRYWTGIRQKIRRTEQNRRLSPRLVGDDPEHYSCRKMARFGVDKDAARINYPFTEQEIKALLSLASYRIDFEKGKIIPMARGDSRKDEL